MQISSCLSNNLGFGCMTTNPWRLEWVGTQAWLRAGILIVAEARIKKVDVLATMSWPYSAPIFFCCNSDCAHGPLQRLAVEIQFCSSTTLLLGQTASTNSSQRLASKIIGTAKESHTKSFTLKL